MKKIFEIIRGDIRRKITPIYEKIDELCVYLRENYGIEPDLLKEKELFIIKKHLGKFETALYEYCKKELEKKQ